jgi:acyl-CoA synthetase (AMP-forming)/AMP-acid ligase II
MSVLAEFDAIREGLSAPGQPFEFTTAYVKGAHMQVYKSLPPNLSHMIVEAQMFGDRTYVVSGERRWTYAEFLPLCAGLARELRERHGVIPGMRVAIAMRNCPEWILGYFATILSGAIAVLINSRGTPEDMANALDDTECAVLLADRRRADALAGHFAGTILTAADNLVFHDAHGVAVEFAPAPVEPTDAQWEDPAIIMFTSGTTGRAKGAVLDHVGVASFLIGLRHNGMCHLARAAKKLGMEPMKLAAAAPPYSTIATFPFFHMSGATAMVLGAAAIGGKIVMIDRWNPSVALKIIERERINILQGPPSLFWDILACPDFAATDTSSVTSVFSGGQALATNLGAAMLKGFPGAMGGGGFGMTETNGPVCTATGDEYLVNPRAAGRIVPGTEIRIVDDDGRDLPMGEAGEIWVRSPIVMKGYWNNPEANAAAFSDGWFRTGDVGFLDADRFITIVDRKKDVVISKGENIYSVEIEQAFQKAPGMMEVAAFGLPDARLGERLVVAIVPHAGQSLDAEALMDFARANLADYKVPTEIIIKPEPFIRNALGKVDKVLLRKSYQAEKEGKDANVVSG